MLTDGRSSRDGVRPAVIMCPSLQEEIIICHEESSSGSSIVTPTNCVEEEDEEEGGGFESFCVFINFFLFMYYAESEKVFVTMKSEIFNFPKASYPCFCLSKLPLFYTCLLFIANNVQNMQAYSKRMTTRMSRMMM